MVRQGLTNQREIALTRISLVPIVIYCVILILAVSTCGSTGQQDVSRLGQRIDEYVQEMLNCSTDGTAYSLAVVKDGKVVLAKGYGYTSANRSREATEQTRFAIGSLTKAFTSLLISKWIHELNNQSVTLDTPIKNFFPDIRLWEDYSTKHVTLKDLLSHRVSTPGMALPLLMGMPLENTRSDYMSRIQYLPSRKYSFREKFVYSNFLYTLPAYIMERMSINRSWEELLKEAILDRLNMTSSGYLTHTDDFSEFALPFEISGNGTPVDIPTEHFTGVHSTGPSGSIYSTAEDMSKWMNFLLSEGRDGQGNTLVDPEVISKTFEPMVPLSVFGINMAKPKDPIAYVGQGYGLGWGIANYRGYRQMLHTGSIVTHFAKLWIYPDLNAGIFIAGNGPVRRKDAVPLSIMHYASDILLGLEPWLNSSSVCSNLDGFFKTQSKQNQSNDDEAEKPSGELTTPLKTYTGAYNHKFFGTMNVWVFNETTLVIDYGRFGHIELQRSDSDTSFNGILMDPLRYINKDGPPLLKVLFEKENDGSINKFGIFLIDGWAYFSRPGHGGGGPTDAGGRMMVTWWSMLLGSLLLSSVSVY